MCEPSGASLGMLPAADPGSCGSGIAGGGGGGARATTGIPKSSAGSDSFEEPVPVEEKEFEGDGLEGRGGTSRREPGVDVVIEFFRWLCWGCCWEGSAARISASVDGPVAVFCAGGEATSSTSARFLEAGLSAMGLIIARRSEVERDDVRCGGAPLSLSSREWLALVLRRFERKGAWFGRTWRLAGLRSARWGAASAIGAGLAEGEDAGWNWDDLLGGEDGVDGVEGKRDSLALCRGGV